MSRSLHAGVVTETEAGAVRLEFAVELLLDEGTQRMWTGIGSKTISGSAYTGVGNLGEVSMIEENADARPSGVRLKLSGVNASLISIALGTHYQGRTAKVYLVFMHLTTAAVIGTPVTMHVGRMDVMDITDGDGACEINLTVENRLADFDRVDHARYYTNEDQQALYPGDVGLEFIAALQKMAIWWGRTQAGSRGGTVGGGGSGGGSGGTNGGGGGDNGDPIGSQPDSTEDQGSSFDGFVNFGSPGDSFGGGFGWTDGDGNEG